jgi:hypothetical protein
LLLFSTYVSPNISNLQMICSWEDKSIPWTDFFLLLIPKTLNQSMSEHCFTLFTEMDESYPSPDISPWLWCSWETFANLYGRPIWWQRDVATKLPGITRLR